MKFISNIGQIIYNSKTKQSYTINAIKDGEVEVLCPSNNKHIGYFPIDVLSEPQWEVIKP